MVKIIVFNDYYLVLFWLVPPFVPPNEFACESRGAPERLCFSAISRLVTLS